MNRRSLRTKEPAHFRICRFLKWAELFCLEAIFKVVASRMVWINSKKKKSVDSSTEILITDGNNSSSFPVLFREVLRQKVRAGTSCCRRVNHSADRDFISGLRQDPSPANAQINSRFDVFDGRGPLVVYEAIVAVDDFFGLPRLVECRLHLNTDKLTHWRGQKTDVLKERVWSKYVLLLLLQASN